MYLTKEQVIILFQGWNLDTAQTDDCLRFNKGIKDTKDSVCYVYFKPIHINIPTKKSFILYDFDRIEMQ